MNSSGFWIFFASTICFQIQVSKSTVDFYVGAVVEYSPDQNATVDENVRNYEMFIEEAALKGADIVVFPEGGLTQTVLSKVPDPLEKIKPCDVSSASEVVKNISCAAENFNIYVAVNLPEEREIIDSEGKKKNAKYNTNVVFDRDGFVVARYAKYNLFDEFMTDHPDRPELSIFDTDFNVRFGTFTCFDILFQTPPLVLVKEYEITDFIFTTRWFSELPFLTALQAQSGWAQANNVNLLASGYNDPRKGSTGSGIFHGSYGSVVHYMGDLKGSKLLVAPVPKKEEKCPSEPTHKRASFSRMIKDYGEKSLPGVAYNELNLLSDQIELFETKVIKTGSDFESEVCSHDDFCCKFDVRVNSIGKNPRAYHYRAVAFNGVRRFGLKATGGVQVCGVIFCDGPKLTNCTGRALDLKGIHEFSKIKIEGNFRMKNSMQIPSTLTGGKELDSLPSHKYEFHTEEMAEERVRKIRMVLDWPTDDLMTFAIWGRDFTSDGRKPSLPVSKASRHSPLFTTFAVFIAGIWVGRNR